MEYDVCFKIDIKKYAESHSEVKSMNQLTFEVVFYPTYTRSMQSFIGLESVFLLRAEAKDVNPRFEIATKINGKSDPRFRSQQTIYCDDSEGGRKTPGKWYHIAIVYDGTKSSTKEAYKMYINGVRETLTPADNSYEDCAPNSSLNLTDVGGNDKALLIGRSGDSYRVGYCKVYQARMWKRALDESEIKANMCKILNAEEHSDLMGYWVFSKGVGGTTVFENWGNGGSGLDAQVCLQNISENKPAWGANFLQLIMEIRAALNQLNVLIHTKTSNMITKKLIKFALLFFLIGLTACDNKLNPGFDPDDYEPIVPPEPVRTMDAMASGERVVLSGASLTDIVLKWTPTEKHGNTVYRYEVLIDTIGGDFTKPVETIFSDNNGLESQLTLTHYQANTIGKLAKFRCNTNGTLRWKVRAYCGLDQALSSLEGYFVIFMMDGIDDMPSENEPVYITGVGTEDDGDEAEAQQMLRQNEGIYQTFTQLKADQPFIFMSTVEGRKCYYYVDDNGVLRERNDGEDYTVTVPQSGIYRITINMGEQTISYDEIGAVYLYNHSGGYRQDFNYLGYGKWGVKNYTARKQTESWAGSGETRHSFKMEINGTTYRWGHKEKDKGQPNLTTDNSYYNLYQLALGTDPWDYSFRFCDELLQWGEKQGNVYYATVKTDVTLYFNAEFGTYTHRWVASETNED